MLRIDVCRRIPEIALLCSDKHFHFYFILFCWRIIARYIDRVGFDWRPSFSFILISISKLRLIKEKKHFFNFILLSRILESAFWVRNKNYENCHPRENFMVASKSKCQLFNIVELRHNCCIRIQILHICYAVMFHVFVHTVRSYSGPCFGPRSQTMDFLFL